MPTPRKFDNPTDATLSRLAREVAPPSHLRRELLALAPRPKRLVLAFWLTSLAPLAAVLVMGISMATREPSLEKAQLDLATFLSTDFELSTPPLPMGQLREWLDARQAPADFRLPAALAARLPEGCRVIDWQGHKATLICFYIPGGPTVHLVVFRAGTFRDLPATPEVSTTGDWSVAMWRAGDGDFLLFGETDSGNLLRFL